MKLSANCPPLLLVYGSNTIYDYDSVCKWFEDSPFNSYEASDVMEALEEISDFTVQSPPDVILLKIEAGSNQCAEIKHFTCRDDSNEPDVPIILLSDADNMSETESFSFGSIKQLKSKLIQSATKHRVMSAVSSAV